MENYENILNQLEEMQNKMKSLAIESNMYKDELLNMKRENEKVK